MLTCDSSVVPSVNNTNICYTTVSLNVVYFLNVWPVY